MLFKDEGLSVPAIGQFDLESSKEKERKSVPERVSQNSPVFHIY